MIEMERQLKPVREMSLIPLINVVFLLLIYFMIAGSLERFDVLNVEPPIAESGEVLAQGFVVVVLGRHEEVLLNDELMTIDDIEPFIRKQLKFDDERVITIKADSRLEAVALVRVIEKVRAAGGKHVTLATQSL